MTWIDELRDELGRQQPTARPQPAARAEEDADESIRNASRLIQGLLEQMNRELLSGRGSVWEADVRWGVRLWELWWGRARTEGQYIVVVLLRDSRGTPYLKVARRRVALHDPLLERRLEWALRAAFLHPGVYRPWRQRSTAGEERPGGGPGNTDSRRGDR